MIEAMSKARPLVITNVSGACDHARHLDNAYVIAQRDPESIHDALRWMYVHRDEAARMGCRARDYVRADLSVQRVIPRFEAVYERVLCN